MSMDFALTEAEVPGPHAVKVKGIFQLFSDRSLKNLVAEFVESYKVTERGTYNFRTEKMVPIDIGAGAARQYFLKAKLKVGGVSAKDRTVTKVVVLDPND